MSGGCVQSWAGNEVIGRWPSRCKKTDGELLLTREHLVHIPHSTGAAGATIVQRSQLTNMQFSKRGAADRAVIMLMTSTGMKVVVELIDAAKRWEHQLDLSEKIRKLCWAKDVKKEVKKEAKEEVKVKLEPADVRKEEASSIQDEEVKSELKQVKREDLRPGAHSEQQNLAEAADKQEGVLQAIFRSRVLKEQYSYLVEQTRALTHAEFLRAHAAEICMHTSLPQAPVLELSTVEMLLGSTAKKSSANAAGGLPVSEEEARAIFQRLPEVEKLYNSQVPLMLKPEQFWTRCLRSRYLAEAFGRDLPPDYRPDPLFDYLEPAKPKALKPAAAFVAATADVSADLMCDAPAKSEEAGPRKKAPLLESLNEHSAGTLAALMATASTPGRHQLPDSVDGTHVDSKKFELSEMLGAARASRWEKVWEILDQHPEYTNELAADVNFALIHYAAFRGELDVLRELIEAFHADPQLLTVDGLRAEQVARREGNTNAADYLAKACTARAPQSAAGHSAASAASAAGHSAGSSGSLTSTVERRRKLLRSSADALREDLCAEPVRKAPRLQLDERYLRPRAAAACLGKSQEAMADAGTLAALQSWASSAARAEAPRSNSRLKAATKWFLREATAGMMKADSRLSSEEGVAAPSAGADVMQLISRAKALLRHFWSSRGSEMEMRTRLVDALVVVQSAMQSHPAKSAMESFTPAIDRAVQVHTKLLRQREMDRAGSSQQAHSLRAQSVGGGS
mmetsp:Transcript_66535/g.116542  ORF Transcript_66535/g.116542 Transcript_66535/m.116542 type:complete len:739 (-) Transcript_66535:33-2249(-)